MDQIDETRRLLNQAIRDYLDARDANEDQEALESADDIIEYYQALDGWLARGGFLPKAWRQGK